MSTGAVRALRLTADGRLADAGLIGDRALMRLLDVLDVDGEEARIVGGAVRNTLLGLPVADVDVTTTATPRVVMRRAKTAGLRAIPTGIEHGTVTVMVGNAAFEVTTLREDVETDGRHAVVRFTRDFAADAARRDFTINALSVDRDGVVHDTTSGLGDLAAGRVRFIGDPDARIREDYLRLLRFFRFHAAYGVGQLDAEGFAAAQRHAAAIARLSKERVRSEWLKLLGAPAAIPTVLTLVTHGIADRVAPGPARPDRLERLGLLESQAGEPPDALLRLAALSADGPDDVLALREHLRLSNGERDRLLAAVSALSAVVGPPNAQSLRALLFTRGRGATRDGLILAAARDGGAMAPWAAVLGLLDHVEAPRLPLGGGDVLARGVSGGRRVGGILKRLQASWIRAGFPQEPAALARLLDEAIAAEE